MFMLENKIRLESAIRVGVFCSYRICPYLFPTIAGMLIFYGNIILFSNINIEQVQSFKLTNNDEN
jgi:hypothetical protein